MVNIFMNVYGKVGLRELAKQNLAKAAYASKQFAKHANLLFQGAPRFNEFVLQTGEDSYALNLRLLENKIVGGLPLKKFYPELGNTALWCCTEMTTRTAIDAVAAVLAENQTGSKTQREADVEEVAR
jgi:glycine dehydrogenase subunit 1